MIRVLVCDDHQIVRQGIRLILADAADVLLAAEAATGDEALQRVAAGDLDVVLLDIALPGRDGLDVLRQLRRTCPRLPVLMFSTYPDRQYAVRCLQLGAAGYLNKSADSEQLIEAIRQVARGRPFLTASVAGQLAGAVGGAVGGGAAAGVASGEDAGRDARPLHERLSARERQVYGLLSQGRSVGEIAAALALAPNTVSTYRARILEKTGVRNDVELALYALREDAGL